MTAMSFDELRERAIEDVGSQPRAREIAARIRGFEDWYDLHRLGLVCFAVSPTGGAYLAQYRTLLGEAVARILRRETIHRLWPEPRWLS